jgi:hypothetical protein
MLTVRFPNGQAVQYNTARFASRQQNLTDIYDKEGGTWIAQIPNDCIIEAIGACRVYDAVKKVEDYQVTQITKELRSLTRKIGKGKK